jgi:Mn2+/Fe2+ NRAMP family transporter
MNTFKAFNKSPIVAAAFLMATSAIGPGFLTQTAVFTNQLLASFGFIILVSIFLDIGAQLNIWRILSVSGMRAQEVANKVIPGAGYMLTLLIVIGGLAFNIGNLAGAGLGLNVLTGLSPETGAAISALIAIGIFIVKDALKWMDGFTRLLGIVMLALTLYVVFSSRPPITEAVQKTFWPDKIDVKAILTLVGGTVGGYISFAGAHRLLDAGLTGEASLPKVNQSAVSAILLASTMRILLFLAALGVVSRGIPLTENNPAASVFQIASGQTGYKIFGIVMWSAAITSVIGSAYTSISFLKTFHPSLSNLQKPMLILFIAISAVIFILNGQPVKTLVFVGALNGFILPFSLGIILLAAYRKKIVQAYHHPGWLTVFGALVVVATLWMSFRTAASFWRG